MAYCFDTACYQWGSYVEAEIAEAAKGAKNDKEAERKVRTVVNKLFAEVRKSGEKATRASTAGRFRDPAARG